MSAKFSASDLTGLALFLTPGALTLVYAYFKGRGNLTDGLSRCVSTALQHYKNEIAVGMWRIGPLCGHGWSRNHAGQAATGTHSQLHHLQTCMACALRMRLRQAEPISLLMKQMRLCLGRLGLLQGAGVDQPADLHTHGLHTLATGC